MNSIINSVKSIFLVWNISKKRIVNEAIATLLNYTEWLFYSSIFLRHIIFTIETNREFESIVLFTIIVSIIFIGIRLYRNYFLNVVTPVTNIIIYRDLYAMLYKKACNVELRCFEDSSFFDKYAMSIDKSDEKISLIIKNTFTILFGGISTIVAFCLMFSIDKFAMLFLISPLIGNFIFGTVLNKIIFNRYKNTIPDLRKFDYINRVMYLSKYAKEIKITNVFNVLSKIYDKALNRIFITIKNYSKKAVIVYWIHTMLTFTIFQGVFGYGVYKTVIVKSMPFSDLSVLVSVTVATTWILIGVTSAFMENINLGLYMNNLFSFINYKEKIPEDQKGVCVEGKIKSIEFDHVSFSYDNENIIINDVSFEVDGNKKIAIVGCNGAGKSTIIKLLLRLYDPTKGRILVNGINIKEYDLNQYRNIFAVALQDFIVFSDSIKNNILMNKKIDDNEKTIYEALEKAGILDEVKTLDRGIDSTISKEFDKNGVIFSGGQLQKIAIARVFAQKAQINIFDEPSSALDPISESEIYERIMQISSGKGMFLISHRLSSVQNVDQILVMDSGTLIDSGSHLELLHRCDLYKRMYLEQANCYISNSD